jgi:hypothetical protein
MILEVLYFEIVDGVWLTWSTWTACTASCGGGTERRHRECHFQQHVPQGDYCKGQSIEQTTCGTDACAGS